MEQKICPRCFGNGYIRIPNEAVGVPKQVVTQCTMCKSQGEIELDEESYNGGKAYSAFLQTFFKGRKQ